MSFYAPISSGKRDQPLFDLEPWFTDFYLAKLKKEVNHLLRKIRNESLSKKVARKRRERAPIVRPSSLALTGSLPVLFYLDSIPTPPNG